MTETAIKYDYHPSGGYATTVATLADGRKMTVDTQYGVVQPHGEHSEICPQLTKIGGRCDCGLLAGVNIPALVADARANGKFGRPEPKHEPADFSDMDRGPICPICHTYCFGDCGHTGGTK